MSSTSIGSTSPSAVRAAWLAATMPGMSASTPRKCRKRIPGIPATVGIGVIGSTIASISAHPLELAGPLGVALGLAEAPHAHGDEHDRHDHERPDVAEEPVEADTLDEGGPDAVEDVGRRRQVRQDLHPAWQDGDGVVDPAHEEQDRLEDERHLR